MKNKVFYLILQRLLSGSFEKPKTLLLALLPSTLFKVDKSVAFSAFSTNTLRLQPISILKASAVTIRAVPDTVKKVSGLALVLLRYFSCWNTLSFYDFPCTRKCFSVPVVPEDSQVFAILTYTGRIFSIPGDVEFFVFPKGPSGGYGAKKTLIVPLEFYFNHLPSVVISIDSFHIEKRH